jgi:hypothetical protein
VTVRRPIASAALSLVALFVFSACGGGSGVSSAASAQLQLRVAAIRNSAAQGDRGAAESQLAQLRVDVVQFRAADKIDDSAAKRILNAAGVVEAKLALLSAPETTTTETTTTTKPPKDKGHGKKGHDKGDGGD